MFLLSRSTTSSCRLHRQKAIEAGCPAVFDTSRLVGITWPSETRVQPTRSPEVGLWPTPKPINIQVVGWVSRIFLTLSALPKCQARPLQGYSPVPNPCTLWILSCSSFGKYSTPEFLVYSVGDSPTPLCVGSQSPKSSHLDEIFRAVDANIMMYEPWTSISSSSGGPSLAPGHTPKGKVILKLTLYVHFKAP
jgi:hypothetical protein